MCEWRGDTKECFSSDNRRGKDQTVDLQKRAKEVAVSRLRQEQKLWQD